ncbi:ABC transporter substrate-binding protein [Ancylobacter oerskovii]|nr:ABC transporter substrate-binding protein [Ancylobacter oerskovii]
MTTARAWWGGLALRLLATLLLAAALPVPTHATDASGAGAGIVLVDAAGRTVRLAAPARRIVLNDSLLLLSLALIDPDPVARIAGWAGPQRLDPGMRDAFRRRFPAIDAIPAIGGVSPANASAEGILGVRPDLVVIKSWQPDWDRLAEIMEAAGVPVLFLEGPASAALPPAEATALSMDILGKALGRQAQADAFNAFVRSRYRTVIDRLPATVRRPSVLVDAFAGTDCCSTPGADNRLTQLVDLAGGRSIGAHVPGYDGRLSQEYVLAANPDVYIGTGGAHLVAQGGLMLGGGIDRERAQASLRAVLSQPIRRDLAAVKQGRAYGVSHQLSTSALSLLVFECFAKWLHPARLADLDPEATLAEINRRFLAVPFEGTFWTAADAGADGGRP